MGIAAHEGHRRVDVVALARAQLRQHTARLETLPDRDGRLVRVRARVRVRVGARARARVRVRVRVRGLGLELGG